MTALLLYLAAVAEDGDFLNDWLTHLPETVQPFVLFAGYVLAMILGV
jgi:hypothetical protein